MNLFTFLNRSTLWFGLVGIAAAITHYGVAVSLEYTGFTPNWANISGFLLAFPVSYFGHHTLSFGTQKNAQKATHKQALPKFFLVAISSFLANHFLLLTSLYFTHLPFWLVLGVVMVVVAVSTYFLSRDWAFKP